LNHHPFDVAVGGDESIIFDAFVYPADSVSVPVYLSRPFDMTRLLMSMRRIWIPVRICLPAESGSCRKEVAIAFLVHAAACLLMLSRRVNDNR
jgi:hypothetical protein